VLLFHLAQFPAVEQRRKFVYTPRAVGAGSKANNKANADPA